MEFEAVVNQVLACETATEFMDQLRAGYQALYDALMQDTRQRKKALKLLEELFAATAAEPRRRRILELCSWPIFDKPALPLESPGLPEFIWVFALPFVVTFAPAQLPTPVVLDGDAFDPDAVLELLEASEAVSSKGHLRVFSTLFRKEDLHAYGPQNIAQFFVGAELGLTSPPQPLPVTFDRDIDCARSVPFFALCACRMQLGEKTLLNRDVVWSAAALEAEIFTGLQSRGLAVEAVHSLPPCSLAETLFQCAGPSLEAMERNLDEATKLYGELELIIRHPMDGLAEVNAFNAAGEEVVLQPPFSFFEPRLELRKTIAQYCERRRLGFRGSFVLPQSSAHLQ